ncbi:SH2 domain-containing protein 3C-like isoform X2 [Cottoperca gobio]|uniref:SH2 domain-containing protein 3C-like isoform X1 n=1 Tax=Cottoperca gobio TaxID=56716 RepID=A0A6J2QAB0_COTGO|nr:SH2 domain-containing protein 3C-like isoform X1 [Cottoperca gobio]XP_029295384.1 SH2 domain-containing protein 3C-like isoform X2 [Cottoperca gobio]
MNKRKLSFKWFGSITNLSNFHPSAKANIKAAPEHDGSRSGDKSAAGEQSVDDMEDCLRSPCYARSSEMYTHVGTVPRSQKQKNSYRGLKEKNKKEEEGVSGGQSQWKAGEHVRDSPLLSALSSLSLTSLDRPLPATPTPSWASPLTSAPESCFNDPLVGPIKSQGSLSRSRYALETGQAVREPSNMATNGPKAALAQDVYVPMDPIAEATRSHVCDQTERQRGVTSTQETTKTVNSFQGVERVDSQQDVTDSSGEYVKFSKDKFWLVPPSEKLRKQLEEELKLNGSNLKSHAWYHGRIPWEVSESLVVNHGDFLIRDSQSSQGDFVLTSHWEHRTLHFVIRKTVVQSSETYTRVQYSLEGEAFDSLQALVHFYAGSKTALTRWSRAQIHQPVNRTLPLSYLETAFCTAVNPPSCHRGLMNSSVSGEERVCPRSPSSLHHREADVNREQDDRPLLTAGESSLSTLYNNTQPSRSLCSSRAASVAPSPSLSRRLDTARTLSSPNNTLHKQCNERPQPHLNQDSLSSDAGVSCYTELYPGPQSYVERLWVEEGSVGIDPLRVEDGNLYFLPVVETVSSFKPSRYQSSLMPKENKPLEVGILRRVKELLAEVDPRTAVKHITKADCMVARILEVTPEVQRTMGVSSGMELLTLPHGQQLRLDLLERFQTMAIMLAVDVLGCTGTTEERAGLLHKIIQIAAELKSTMGNMFGFAAVMRALELPQVSRLEQTWTALRQRHTEGAILYEKTLRPFMKSLNDGRESCPLSNTSFPHVLPLLSLLEKSMAVGEGTEPWETVEVGVDVVMFHLGAARTIAQLGGIYRSNAECKLQGFPEQAEVLELFLTDFQMRLLWGSKGAEESQALRYAKFDQVLTALSYRLEPPVRPR